MYVHLSLAKEHCEVTSDISDALLQFYIDSSEERAATYLNRPLATLLDPVSLPDGSDPSAFGTAVRHGILLYVADSINNRGTIITGTISSELQTAQNILHPYRLNLGV